MRYPSIVMVEDNPGDRILLETVLKEANVSRSIHSFANGRAALEYLRSHPVPDVVVVDSRLPDCTGLEIARELATDRNLRKVPVVLLSGSITPRDREIAEQNGIICWQKASSLDEWMDLARSILDCIPPDSEQECLPAA